MTVTQAEASPLPEDAVRPFAHLRRDDVDYAGGKGANLAEMSSLGLPVPPGFTITTEACNAWYTRRATWPDGLETQVDAALAGIERRDDMENAHELTLPQITRLVPSVRG